MSQPKIFKEAINIGTCEVKIWFGADTLQETMPPNPGAIVFANVDVLGTQASTETVEVEASNRGEKFVYATFGTKSMVSYTFDSVEMTDEMARIAYQGGPDTSNNARGAYADQAADVAAYTPSSPAIAGRWNDIYVSNARQQGFDSALVFCGTPVAATTTDAGDVFTATAHGLAVGDRVIVVTVVSTTGITLLQPYYVKTIPTADTFTLSATSGGSTLALTTNGSCTFLAALEQATLDDLSDGDVAVDLVDGSYRFAANQTTNAYVYLTAAERTSASDGYFTFFQVMREGTKTGYAEVTRYDAATRAPKYRHKFKTTVTADSMEDSNGKNPAKCKVKLAVNDRASQFGTANAARYE